MFAEVVVDIVHSNLSRSFSYAVPDGMRLEIGMRVSVPFNHSRIYGIVVDLSEHCDLDPRKIKPIHAVLEDYPAILPQLIQLARQMAQEAHCPVAETLRLMLPPEMRRAKIKIKQETTARLLPIAADTLQGWIQKYGSARKKGMLLHLLSDFAEHSIQELTEFVGAPLQPLKKLAADGLIELNKREVFRLPYEDTELESLPDPPLMEQQQHALQIIEEDSRAGANAFLIHGVTGSGKTEVYIRLVKQALREGKGVIILVPEISLTPQMVRWFRERFSNSAAVLHSRLSAGEKYDEWRRIRLSQARVVIGARSAIFAPVDKLGLIVVDEEHETTYQSDRHPQYDARHIAQLRVQNEGGIYVLSSATPSIKSFAMALRGNLTLIEMPKRVMDRPLPTVSVVDMRKELQSGNRSMFSTLLLSKMKKHLDSGSQIILFLNRRGHSTFISCRNCGHVMQCDNCDISMTYHMESYREQASLKCHVCGCNKPIPNVCPSCGSRYIRYFGVGTQKVEEELQKQFPQAKIARMDLDTTTTKNAHAEILESFRKGKAQILIGTQMITKGLDFPNVTLVGVIAADVTLNLPDYRAPERTFQLITQVAGRAGRANQPGEVVIQTYKPEHSVIVDAANQDYRAFFTKELERRKKSFYPPYTQIVRLLIEGRDKQTVFQICTALYAQIKEQLAAHPQQKKRLVNLHMDEAPVKRINNNHRYQILLKLFVHADAEALKAFLEQLARLSYEDAHVLYEVDPTNMM